MSGTGFAPFLDEYVRWSAQEYDPSLLDGLRRRVPADGMVLDAGCGDGALALGLAPFVRHIVGIDIEPGMIARAREAAQGAAIDNACFVVADLARLPLADAGFDLIVCSFALHHTPVDETLPRLATLLKPGGWLFIQEPTCPVPGVWRPLWYRWQGLKVAGRKLRHDGPAAAWRAGCFHQRRAWIRHQVADRHWDAPRWRAVVDRHLPNATLRRAENMIAALWQRPAAPPEPESAANRRSARALPTRLARHYPLPPPDGYLPFPAAALDGSVVARFEDQVLRHRGRLAIRTHDGDLSYASLNTLANRVAHALLARGVACGDRVAVLMDQDEPIVPAILGVLKAGCAYVALNPDDSGEQHGRIQALAEAGILITTANRTAVADAVPGAPGKRLVWEALDDGPATDPGVPIGSDALAAIFFTSGSSGEPKGVARDHRQLLYSVQANTDGYYVAPGDRQSMLHFPGFTASVPNIYDTLLNGATLCPLNPRRLSIAALWDWLARMRITHFNPPIGLWRAMLAGLPLSGDWPELRLVTLGGERIHGKDLRQFQATFGPHVVLQYGLAMTEAGAVTRGFVGCATPLGDGPVAAGYPLPGKDVVIIDDAGHPVETGETGRIAITSQYLSLGYWRDDERTAACFRPAARSSGWRTFVSSDRGYLEADGGLAYLGRDDSVVKVRGYRVDTGAVEAALGDHAQIVDVAVMLRKRGDDHPVLVACLTGKNGQQVSTESLRGFLGRRLPHFMIPERFVWLDAMPVTRTGKIDRRSLAALDAARPDLEQPFVAPRSALELRIATIWAELLELDRVGVHDDFIDLGGDSLLAMTMVQRLEQRLGVATPPGILDAVSVAQLAQKISRSATTRDPGAAAPTQRKLAVDPGFRWRYVRRIAVRRWLRKGPVWGERHVPYALGVRLQRTFIARQWLHRRIVPAQLEGLAYWPAWFGDACDDGPMTINLMAGTWQKWRGKALTDPSAFDEWVTFSKGSRERLETLDRSRGKVLVVSHSVEFSAPLLKLLRAQGRETATVWGIHGTGDNIAYDRNAETLHRAGRLAVARQVLERKGVVIIAGDGRAGEQSVWVPFHGRWRRFQIGAAWLAVRHDADFMPLFVTIDVTGRVHVDVADTLVAGDRDEADRIAELTRLYGELYARRWPSLYMSMDWSHLDYNSRLAGITESSAHRRTDRDASVPASAFPEASFDQL